VEGFGRLGDGGLPVSLAPSGGEGGRARAPWPFRLVHGEAAPGRIAVRMFARAVEAKLSRAWRPVEGADRTPRAGSEMTPLGALAPRLGCDR
jgi:hypothetical protein